MTAVKLNVIRPGSVASMEHEGMSDRPRPKACYGGRNAAE